MTAKEMFEELGYKYTYDDGYIIYTKEERNGLEPTYISFYMSKVFLNNESDDNDNYNYGINFDMELLKAIDKQCSELWRSYNE